jgi:hypothetical protein
MGIAFVFVDRSFSKYIAGYVTVGCLALDAVLATATVREEWYYLLKVWRVIPFGLVLWAVLWFAWHVLVAMLWIRLARTKRSKRERIVSVGR